MVGKNLVGFLGHSCCNVRDARGGKNYKDRVKSEECNRRVHALSQKHLVYRTPSSGYAVAAAFDVPGLKSLYLTGGACAVTR